MSLFQQLQRGELSPAPDWDTPSQSEVEDTQPEPTLYEETTLVMSTIVEKDDPPVVDYPLFTREYCFDFSYLAPLFETFTLGDDTLHQVSATDIQQYFSSFNEELIIQYVDNQLTIRGAQNGVVGVGRFGWKTESPIRYREYPGNMFEEGKSKYYDELSLAYDETIKPTSPTVDMQPTVTEIDTSDEPFSYSISTDQYTWDFCSTELIFTRFVMHDADFIDVPVSQLVNKLSEYPFWVEQGFELTVEDDQVTIRRPNTDNVATLNKFHWETRDDVIYRETSRATGIISTNAEYGEVLFHSNLSDLPLNATYAVRQANTDDGAVWESLGQMNPDDERTHQHLSILPKGMTITLRTVEIDGYSSQRLVLKGQPPREGMKFDATFAEVSNMYNPTFVYPEEPHLSVVTPAVWENDEYILPDLSVRKYVTVITPSW